MIQVLFLIFLSFFKALDAATGADCRYLCALQEVWCVPNPGSVRSLGWRGTGCSGWDPRSGGTRTLLGQTQALWAEVLWDLVGSRGRMPCAELPQLHVQFAEAEQPPGQGRHTLGESMRQEPGCPFCTRQIASHNSLAVPPTLPAAMQEADRAQLGPCVPACALDSVLTTTSTLNAPVGLSRVTGGTGFTQQN